MKKILIIFIALVTLIFLAWCISTVALYKYTKCEFGDKCYIQGQEHGNCEKIIKFVTIEGCLNNLE